MALTDRHFIAEHFDILFAIFGLMVQKICQFKVQIHFLLIVFISGIWAESFCTRAGLARVADRWASCHAGTPRWPGGHWQV